LSTAAIVPYTDVTETLAAVACHVYLNILYKIHFPADFVTLSVLETNESLEMPKNELLFSKRKFIKMC
jgi:hypothetical protein